MHAQPHADNRRARRNAPGNIEGKHRPANVALARSAGEKMIARAIAKVDINVLVQRVVFAGVKSDLRRALCIGRDPAQRGRQHNCQ